MQQPRLRHFLLLAIPIVALAVLAGDASAEKRVIVVKGSQKTAPVLAVKMGPALTTAARAQQLADGVGALQHRLALFRGLPPITNVATGTSTHNVKGFHHRSLLALRSTGARRVYFQPDLTRLNAAERELLANGPFSVEGEFETPLNLTDAIHLPRIHDAFTTPLFGAGYRVNGLNIKGTNQPAQIVVDGIEFLQFMNTVAATTYALIGKGPLPQGWTREQRAELTDRKTLGHLGFGKFALAGFRLARASINPLPHALGTTWNALPTVVGYTPSGEAILAQVITVAAAPEQIKPTTGLLGFAKGLWTRGRNLFRPGYLETTSRAIADAHDMTWRVDLLFATGNPSLTPLNDMSVPWDTRRVNGEALRLTVGWLRAETGTALPQRTTGELEVAQGFFGPLGNQFFGVPASDQTEAYFHSLTNRGGNTSQIVRPEQVSEREFRAHYGE